MMRNTTLISLRPIVLCLGLAMACAPSLAAPPDTLPDPTRPAAAWLDAQASDGKPKVVVEPPRPTVIVRGGGRQIAVVDGQQMRVGDTLGDAKLVRIEPGRLVFSNGDALSLTSEALPRPTGRRP